MNETDLSKLIEAINKSTSATVETVVNGKIRHIDQKLTDYIHDDLKWKEEKVEPLIEAHSTVKNLAIFLKWGAGVVVSIGVLIKLIALEKL